MTRHDAPTLGTLQALAKAFALRALSASSFEGAYVPARIEGMSEDQPRPDLDVRYWAEIDLPEGVELSPLGERHLKGLTRDSAQNSGRACP